MEVTNNIDVVLIFAAFGILSTLVFIIKEAPYSDAIGAFLMIAFVCFSVSGVVFTYEHVRNNQIEMAQAAKNKS